MKKSYFLMAAAATMFAACSQSDVLNEVQVLDEAQAIGFSTYSAKATRAENNNTAVNTTNLETHHKTFKVWGYKNTYAEYVFGGVRVSAADAGNWTYSPKKYWDKAATSYQFYAAAPDNGLWQLSSNTTAQDDDYFYISSFELQGTSLAHTSHQSSFETVADCDLMIAVGTGSIGFSHHGCLSCHNSRRVSCGSVCRCARFISSGKCTTVTALVAGLLLSHIGRILIDLVYHPAYHHVTT